MKKKKALRGGITGWRFNQMIVDDPVWRLRDEGKEDSRSVRRQALD